MKYCRLYIIKYNCDWDLSEGIDGDIIERAVFYYMLNFTYKTT